MRDRIASRSADPKVIEGVTALIPLIIFGVIAALVTLASGFVGVWVANTLFGAAWLYDWSRVMAMGVLIVFIDKIARRKPK